MKSIVIDVLGGDDNTREMILGVRDALLKYGNEYHFTVAGPEEEIREILGDSVTILDAQKEVTNATNPMDMLHDAEDTALVKCYKYIRENEKDVAGLITVSSTACVLVGAIFKLGMIHGIKAPVLASEMYRPDFTKFLLIDCGATVDSNAGQMLDFARIGNAFEKAMGISSPKIALANLGAEPGKGNKLMKEAYKKLAESGLDFKGNVEFNRIFFDDFDVLVTDGAVGNCILKTSEGVGRILMEKSGMDDASRKFTDHMLNFTDQGAAMLLGPKTIILKAHGAATSDTIVGSVSELMSMDKGEFISLMTKEFAL